MMDEGSLASSTEFSVSSHASEPVIMTQTVSTHGTNSTGNSRTKIQKRASLQLEGRSSEAVDLLLANRQQSQVSPKAKTGSQANLLKSTEGVAATSDVKGGQTPQNNKEIAATSPSISKIAFKRKIVGDIFGTNANESLAGLMYRSRIIDQDFADPNNEVQQEDSLLQESLESSVSVADSDGDSEEESKMLKTMNPKQQLAVTIKNWLMFPENDEMVMEEGAVYALIALSKVDDSTIRRCCACSFYQLSARESNREKLLQTGTAAGVVYITLQSKSIKVARLAAYTLCNLSKQADGEAIMAEENCMLALAALPAMLPSLFPICMQAMYNMTCSGDYFKKVDRIIKALLDFSSVGYDKSEYVIKALVNCSRFSWLRLRIIEFGAINHLHTMLTTAANWESGRRQELVFHMLTALRSISDSPGCCAEMLQKGTVDILQVLLKYSQDKERLLIVKIVHNFLQAPSQLSLTAFANTVHILHALTFKTSFIVILQYCAACFLIVTREKIRGLKDLAVKIIEAMSVLLPSPDSLTQYFAISTAGNLFFGNLCDDPNKLETLIQYFVNQGASIADPQAKQALALALAKLSEEGAYLAIIERLGLLDKVLVLLMSLRGEHRDSMELQESCCIAVCRIALRIQSQLSLEQRTAVAHLLLDMLQYDDKYVLSSAVSGLRALASSGIFPKEVLYSNPFFKQIASLVTRFAQEVDLCRFSCAVLAVFSYDVEVHDLLCEDEILDVLFRKIESDDIATRELVGNSLCNLSLHAGACAKMIRFNVVALLGKLSSSTSEAILDLCAKCLCNLTCHKELHRAMIQNAVLDILLMISLVRTVSSQTKCTCAKALLNLLTDENLMDIMASGAIRIFASLASIPFAPVQKVCSKGFHLMTMTAARRRELVKNPAVLHALFNMIKGTVATSNRVKVRLGISIINLLSCPETNFDVIKTGALSCLKLVATMGHESLRDATGRLIITLSSDRKFHPLLLREPLVAMLILILQEHEAAATFQVAIHGLSCLARYEDFKKLLLRDKCWECLMGTIFQGQVTDRRVAREVCKVMTQLSYVHEQVDQLVQSNAFAVALGVLHACQLAQSVEVKTLVLLMIRNVSESVNTRRYLVEEGIFGMLVQLLLEDTAQAQSVHPPPSNAEELESQHGIPSLGYAAMVRVIYNLSHVPTLHDSLLKRCSLMSLLQAICLPLDDANTNNNASSSAASPAREDEDTSMRRQLEDAISFAMSAIAEGEEGTPSRPGTADPTATATASRKRVTIVGGSLSAPVDTDPRALTAGEPVVPVQRRAQSMQNLGSSVSLGRGSSKVPFARTSSVSEDEEEQQPGLQPPEGGGSAESESEHSAASDSRTHTVYDAKRNRLSYELRPEAAARRSLEIQTPTTRDDAFSTASPRRTLPRLFFTSEQVNWLTQSLQLLSQSPSCHEFMVHEGQIMRIFRALIHADMSSSAQCEISACLAQLAQTRACREPLVAQGAVELLIALSISADANTQAQCATALAYLSEITHVTKGVVASLLLLELHLEDAHGGLQHYSKDELLSLVQQHANAGTGGALIRSRALPDATSSSAAAATAGVAGGAGGKDDKGKDAGSGASVGSMGARSNSSLSNPNATAGNNNNATAGNNNNNSANAKGTPGSAGAADASSVGGGWAAGPAASGVKTLSSSMSELLRDLMKDKRRFDQYVEALQRNNKANLEHNHFHAHTPAHAQPAAAAAAAGAVSALSTLTAGSGAASLDPALSASMSATPSQRAPTLHAAATATTASLGLIGPGSRAIRAIRASPAQQSQQQQQQQQMMAVNCAVGGLQRAELDHLLRTALHTRLSVHPPRLRDSFLRHQESVALQSSFEEFMFATPGDPSNNNSSNAGSRAATPTPQNSSVNQVNFYKMEHGGLSRPLTVDIKLPSIPPDRDLDRDNRHRDLLVVPINKDPLPKDLRAPEAAESSARDAASASMKRNSLALADPALATVDEDGPRGKQGLSPALSRGSQHSLNTSSNNSNNNNNNSGNNSSKPGRFGRMPSLGAVGRHASDNNLHIAKARALDPRSPLVRGGSQLFSNSNSSINSSGGNAGANMSATAAPSSASQTQSQGQKSRRRDEEDADEDAPGELPKVRARSSRGGGLRASFG